jgi:tetratricopeptide (TPR) repeat protein
VHQALAAVDPRNTGWQSDLAASCQRLGDLALSTGMLDDARTWFDQAYAVRAALAAKAPSNTGWQSDLAASYQRLGDLALSTGKLDDARTWFDKSLTVRKVLATGDPSNAGWQRDLCIALARTAQVRQGRTEAASVLDQARAIYDRFQRSNLFRDDVQFVRVGKFLASGVGSARPRGADRPRPIRSSHATTSP